LIVSEYPNPRGNRDNQFAPLVKAIWPCKYFSVFFGIFLKII